MKFLLIFMIPFTLMFCGDGGPDVSMKVEKKVKRIELSDISAPKSGAKILKITGVKFGPSVDVENDVQADPVLSVPGAAEDFRFRWFVNDREVEGENNASLSRDYFRENDWIYCIVSIQDEGKSHPEFKSKMVRVRGPLPKLNPAEIEEFTVPGVFRYRIDAEMSRPEESEPAYEEAPENNPAQTVTFELVSPLDKGIELNRLTGELVWNITREILDELGDKVTIQFSITSPSGRKVGSSLSLSLVDEDQKKKSSDNNSPMGSEIE